MRHISNPQKKKLHVLAREMGMDNDLLHEYVYAVTGKEHISELTIQEGVKVIDGLENKKSYEKGDKITCRQESYLKILAVNLGWITPTGDIDEKRINGFVKKLCHVENYHWLSVKMASNVIEALKEMSLRNAKEMKEE